ncbi:ATPase [Muricauda sp. NBRC 101325]|nr:ATPase [Muricauda sp. NBRC 101325]
MLLYRWILVPVFYLFKIKNGIGYKEASKLIGIHFKEVDDKLLNLLELSESNEKSDLLLASIDQRAAELNPVPFLNAVNFKESFSYAKYIVLPVVILTFIWITGDIISFFNSHQRVVHYNLAYEKPAPFSFLVLNESLNVLDDKPLTIEVAIKGEVRPESVSINLDGEEVVMYKQGNKFLYTLEAPVTASSFYLVANGWNSKTYEINSYSTPGLTNFEMQLDYPSYLNRPNEKVIGTGNTSVPEGTKITWSVEGVNTDNIAFKTSDSTYAMARSKSVFSTINRIFNDFEYTLSTSNENVKDYEQLSYLIDVVKDEKAKVKVNQTLDSLNPNQSYYEGQATDDYGLAQIRLVCVDPSDRDNPQNLVLEEPKESVYQFYYTFPSGLNVQQGKKYELYFEVVDNDGVRGGKVTKSQTFNTVFYSEDDLLKQRLEERSSSLSKANSSLEKSKTQMEELKRLSNSLKEENALNFENRNALKDLIQKQNQQEEFMQKFTKEMADGLKKDESSEMNKMLQERLKRQEIEARKNEKLLKQLDSVADKINKEDLQKSLEELGKNQSKNTRSLEQILELTKKYYVTEKLSQLAQELEKLAERQEILSDLKLGEDFSNKEQEKLNSEFQEMEKQLDQLQKDNSNLQKPVPLSIDDNKVDDIKQDQQDALEEINKHKGSDQSSQNEESQKSQNSASKKQKSAAQKMKEMAQSMGQSGMSGEESDAEDAEMLRQILDNLVRFSFKQEDLFDRLQTSDVDISQFSKTVKEQQNLKRLFEHVDDSLFALSLRRAELSEFVNEQITEVYYNIDKSLESISENQIYQGAAYQQYVINATNALADFLANVLDNMQENMGGGQSNGGGQGFQLPDIIQGQQSIQNKMNGQNKGSQGQPSDEMGQQGQQGKSEQSGPGEEGSRQNENGQKGAQQKDGNEGSQGNGNAEMNLNEVYEIYKEQQFLRQQLEKQLEDMINQSDKNLAKKLLQQMEDFEEDLLENGITNRSVSKANNIQHQLMKLENASMEQGEKKERESETNDYRFTNPITTRPDLLKEYQNEIEILNRQALPLRRNFEKKVKVYFDND